MKKFFEKGKANRFLVWLWVGTIIYATVKGNYSLAVFGVYAVICEFELYKLKSNEAV